MNRKLIVFDESRCSEPNTTIHSRVPLKPYIARIKMKKCPLFVDVLSICRKYMIARILNLLQLVAELSARWQHQIVSHYLHGFKNYEFWKRGTRFVTLKSHCAI